MRSIIRQGMEAIVLKSGVGQRVKGQGPGASSDWADDRGLNHSVVSDLIVLKRNLVQCTIYVSGGVLPGGVIDDLER